MRFQARFHDDSSIEIDCDGVLKNRGDAVEFYCDVAKTRTVMRPRLFGAPVEVALTSNERQWVMVIPLKSLKFVCPVHILPESERQPASGMEAATAGETSTEIEGSPEGDSPTGEAGTPND